MPLAFRCAGSARRGTLELDDITEPASMGSATHEALRPVAEGRGIQWDELPAIAARWNVDAEELRILTAMGNKLWPTVSESFKDALTEVELSLELALDIRLTGHVDLLSVSGTVARAADWKTGRKDHDYSHQMKAYGTLILLDDPSLTEVTITLLWLRDGDIENYTMDRACAQAWLAELRDRVLNWDGIYHPGHQCDYCRRSHECSARNALVRRDVATILDQPIDDARALDALPPETVLTLYRRANMIAKCADRVRKAVHSHVEAKQGVVTSSDGKLVLEEESERELLPLAAWPVLEASGFHDEDFAEVVTLPISRVENRTAKKAGKGKGAAAVRDLREKLDAAGAIKVNKVRKLKEMR